MELPLKMFIIRRTHYIVIMHVFRGISESRHAKKVQIAEFSCAKQKSNHVKQMNRMIQPICLIA